jgi:N utilization substance protein A
MRTEFFAAISAIAAERGIPRERIIEQVEKALAAAYRRSLGDRPPVMDVRVEIDPVKGDPHVYSELLVVDEVEDPRFEISIEDARKVDPSIQQLDKIMVETTPRDFGRIAAQTAKQVILQGIRDVERDNVYVEFNERRGELMIGQVQRNVNGNIIIDLGKAEAILPKDQQVASDNYRPGTRLKVILARYRHAV